MVFDKIRVLICDNQNSDRPMFFEFLQIVELSRESEFALEQSYFAQDFPQFIVLYHFNTVLFYRTIITHKTQSTTEPNHINYTNTMISVEEMIFVFITSK